jgi:hypothetical protein
MDSTEGTPVSAVLSSVSYERARSIFDPGAEGRAAALRSLAEEALAPVAALRLLRKNQKLLEQVGDTQDILDDLVNDAPDTGAAFEALYRYAKSVIDRLADDDTVQAYYRQELALLVGDSLGDMDDVSEGALAEHIQQVYENQEWAVGTKEFGDWREFLGEMFKRLPDDKHNSRVSNFAFYAERFGDFAEAHGIDVDTLVKEFPSHAREIVPALKKVMEDAEKGVTERDGEAYSPVEEAKELVNKVVGEKISVTKLRRHLETQGAKARRKNPIMVYDKPDTEGGQLMLRYRNAGERELLVSRLEKLNAEIKTWVPEDDTAQTPYAIWVGTAMTLVLALSRENEGITPDLRWDGNEQIIIAKASSEDAAKLVRQALRDAGYKAAMGIQMGGNWPITLYDSEVTKKKK